MASAHVLGSARAASRRCFLPLLAVLLACSGGSGHGGGGTAPTLSGFSFWPDVAGVNEGGGAVAVSCSVGVQDPDADVARLVMTIRDEAGAQVSQDEGPVTNPPGATVGQLQWQIGVPTTAVATLTIEVQAFDARGNGSNVLSDTFVVVEGFPLPVITALSPASAAAGSASFTLTVTGSGFVPQSTVVWNGYPLTTTTYVDGTTLRAQVDSYRLSYAGTAQVTVRNPAPGGGTSAPWTFTIDPPPPNPVPVLASISPTSVDAGGAGVTLTVTGSGFTAYSSVLWNGSWMSTTFVDSTTLTATISSYYTSSPGTATVKVMNPTPGGGTSSGLTFTVTRPSQPGVRQVSLKANDLVWDPYQRKIYVSVPSLSPVNPNTVTVLDPFTGELGAAVFVGSEPGRLALSDDGRSLYVGLRGASSVERLALPDLASDLSIALGRDPVYGPYYACDLQVAPGAPATTAVSLCTTGGSSNGSGGVAIFDDATQRPTRAPATASWYPYDSLQWGATSSTLYATATGYLYDVYVLGVDASGVALQTTYRNALAYYPDGIRFDAGTGLLYAEDGRVVDPATGALAGTYATSGSQRRVVPDSSLDSAFFASGDSYYGQHVALAAFDLDEYYPIRSTTVSYVGAPPRRLIRWGTDGLAFLTPDLVVLVQGSFVLPPSATANPAPAIASVSPSSATAGAPNPVIAVHGTGFVRGSTVRWNGNERTTAYVSATDLVAYLPASDLAAAGSGEITVASPAPGGGTSAAATFTVSP